MVKNRILLFFLFFTFTFQAFSQTARKHIVWFSNKEGTPYSVFEPEKYLSPQAIDRREKYGIAITDNDLPVSPVYKDSILSTGASVLNTSKWFNAAIVLADDDQLNQIKKLSFVKNSESIAKRKFKVAPQSEPVISSQTSVTRNSENNAFYGNSYHQVAMMNVHHMHSEGYTGEGMMIAVLDAGFQKVDQLPYFKHLFDENKIIATWDFVDNEEDVYDDHSHGTHVLSLIGSYVEGQLIGTAYKADFLLVRTEDASSELQIEEINWLLGAEYADSAGADIIQTSLGYSTFDDPSMNYTYADLDGKTALVTRASDLAASKGMLLVTSAGNEGSKPWRYITVPADSDNVLTIGAVNQNGSPASFSSIGPTADGRIKPDVTAQGSSVTIGHISGSVGTGSGTSYSAPLVAGLAAGLWQSCPEKTAEQIRNIIRQSSSMASEPDYIKGYGIPDYLKARELMRGGEVNLSEITFGPNPVADEPFYINIPSEEIKSFDIKVIDNTGKTIENFSGTAVPPFSRFLLDTETLLPGMYLIQISYEKKSNLFRLLKIGR